MAQTVDSVACSFPAELIEMVLKDLPILDLMNAASSMPSTWRAVIEDPMRIAARIKHYAWHEDDDRPTTPATPAPRMPFRSYSCSGAHPLAPSSRDPIRAGQPCTIKYTVPNVGTLYIRCVQARSEGANVTISTTPSEAFFFCPDIDPFTIRILDPGTENINYSPGPRFGHGFFDLRDCEGILVFSKGISTSQRDLLFKYVVTYYGGEECDENGLLRDAKKVDKGVGTARKYVGVAENGATTGESGGLRRSGRIVKKTEKGGSLTTK